MANQGKWGWYPCDIETYHKLKAINLAYDTAIHKMKRWERWERKDVANRVIRKKLRDSSGKVVGYAMKEPMPEPEICSVFCKKTTETVYKDKYGRPYAPGFVLNYVDLVEDSVYDDYRKARYPVVSEADVIPLSINLEKIDRLYSAIKSR